MLYPRLLANYLVCHTNQWNIDNNDYQIIDNGLVSQKTNALKLVQFHSDTQKNPKKERKIL